MRKQRLKRYEDNKIEYGMELKAGSITQKDYDDLIKANNELYKIK